MYLRTLTPALLCVCAPAAFGGTWINFFDETADRVVCESTLFADDDQEKDYAWGDVDRDGDIDLVIVRKEPFTSSGRYPNVLLLNEGGVLVDYTDQYAVAADVAGDEGFLTPTNDRDVILVDLNDDVMVTRTTLMDGAQAHFHPHLHEPRESNDLQVPLRGEPHSGNARHGHRDLLVAAGDIDGDGDEDLYFGDKDSGPEQISTTTTGADQRRRGGSPMNRPHA